jgi:hypothetical protein
MPTVAQDGIDDWIAPAQASSAADGVDDWIAPANVVRDHYPDDWIHPDDWIAPASAASPNAGSPVPNAQPSVGDRSNPPAARPDPLAAYWSLIPASRAGAMAWQPPILSPPNPFSHENIPASKWVTPPPIFLNSPEQLPLTQAVPPGAPSIPAGGLLGALANLPAMNSAAGDGVVGAIARLGQPLSPSNVLLDRVLFNAPPGLDPALPGLEAGESSRSPPPASLQHGSGSDQPARFTGAGEGGEDPERGPSAESQDNPSESLSITRVVRDSTGRPLAIIHAQPAPSYAHPIENDAIPDILRAGTKYAQTNKAITGNPFIDRTTDMLLDILQQSVEAMGSGRGPLFGTRVHADFARRVKQFDLPGIGQNGVEQSYHFDRDFIWYGMDGTIRTDITLRNPKDPEQRPVAVYELKTGNAVLRPRRVEEILRAMREKDLPVIVLYYGSGDAVEAPRQ